MVSKKDRRVCHETNQKLHFVARNRIRMSILKGFRGSGNPYQVIQIEQSPGTMTRFRNNVISLEKNKKRHFSFSNIPSCLLPFDIGDGGRLRSLIRIMLKITFKFNIDFIN